MSQHKTSQAPQTPSPNGALITKRAPRSPAAEAFRIIRTNMEFMGAQGAAGMWLFTSALAAEGKSTIVANLGVTLAAASRRTLLIDADMRRPNLHALFGIEIMPGLSQVLTGRKTWQECVRTIDEGLDVLPSGPQPPNPTELLQTELGQRLFAEVGDHYEVVLVDAPPALMVADAQVLARWVDQVVLVARAGFTRRDALQEAFETLQRSGAKRVSTILNQVRRQDGYAYYAYYYANASKRS